MALKMLIGMSPFKLVYGKASHFPVELEHKAFWVIKQLNMNAQLVVERRLLELNEMDEFRVEAYENSRLYKEKTKKWYDRKLLPRKVFPGKQILLYNSRLKLFSGKMKSKWSGPFIVHQVHSQDAIEITNLNDGMTFKVNGQRLKAYNGAPIMCDKSASLLNGTQEFAHLP
ncbi:uncharacterized protein LOC120200424 [Hibiscus syriacus]|uniref:uncharacterized protein LOC120200424 n=1 Tax=Hibiscus syriacus TaxID=106335 RepID=UPI001923683A|nr:uncharacterized protein LOC120200424 [Hibiscus syriacus]